VRYAAGSGFVRQVGFTLLEVRRDGRPEPHFTERLGDFIRIYAGERSVFLRPGEYTYTFRYRITRQIGHFAEYDEVYWNATGNFWSFPIAKAVATVTLPEGARIVQHAAYTGRFGESGSDYAVTGQTGNSITFETTRMLAPREGLTIAVAFPKGIVAEPGGFARFLWDLWDNLAVLILAVAAVGTGTYYYTTWDRVGRDPAKGLVIPMFAPPAGLSPAAVSYVHFQGFAAAGGSALRAFIAALMALAVKRLIEIDDASDTVELKRTGEPKDALPGGEAVIMNSLPSGGSFAFTKANGETIKKVQTAFRSAILREHEGVFFRNNYGYFIVGAIVSVAALAAFVFLARPAEEDVVLLAAMFAGALGGAFLISMGARRILGWLPGGGSVVFGILLSFVGAFILLIVVGLFLFGAATPIVAALPIIAIALVNVAFFHLLRAPTVVGRKVMDEIEGFQLYLSVAEAEWMNMKAPEMSPDLFEAYLPYAVALGVEKPWSDAFQSHMARVMPGSDAASSYRPSWYRGSWSSDSLGRATSGMVSSLSSSMKAAMPSSSSSGSGGGGSSGGGGGGGGGGGW
ncbi:MAG TPA: DUF2207 domain-containing protein, partial [Hyphomicrobiales bacterium]|nr:DUF2207 domain-containing protein [Hyphomicrobiales bacterium]